MRIYTINYAMVVVNLESFMVLQKSIKRLLMTALLFNLFFQSFGHPRIRQLSFLFLYIKDLTSNEYSVKDSFDFAKEILLLNSHCFMESLEITSLLTNIPLGETLNICSNELFDKKQYVSNLDQASFEKFLQLATKESIFIFDKTFYKQLDGVAMGSILVNAFLCYHKKRWLDKCHEKFKPALYMRFGMIFLYSSERKNTLNYF